MSSFGNKPWSQAVRRYAFKTCRNARQGGHSTCVRYLLKRNAEVDLPDIKAQTPLFVAIQKQYTDCVRALLEAGANPNGNPENRSTPLYIAAQIGYLEGVKILLASGAETEVKQRLLGPTPGLPLHISGIYHHFRCYFALLVNGAEPDLRFLRPPVPSTVCAQVSLTHVLVKHRCPTKFGILLIEFGGNLWQRDVRGQLATELVQDAPCKRWFLQIIDKPRCLQSLCRVAIRRTVGRQRLRYLTSLPVPKKIFDYLIYMDIMPNATEYVILSERGQK